MAHIKKCKIIIASFIPLILIAQTERWVYQYNGPGNALDECHSLVYGTDGNIYAAGYSMAGAGTNLDFIVIKLASDGTERWIYRYSSSTGTSTDEANAIVYGADGNLYVAGSSSGGAPSYSYDFTVISLTTDGTERWVYKYDGPGDFDDIANAIVYGADGNLYIAGHSRGSGTYWDFTVISLDTLGTERWVYRYDGPGHSWDDAFSIIYGSDGNLYVAGYSVVTYLGPADFTVISLTSDGTERWIYTYDGPGQPSGGDYAYSIVYGADGNIYAAGHSWGGFMPMLDFTVISLDTLGTERWVYRYAGSGNFNDVAFEIVYGADGNLYAAGFSTESDTGIASTFIIISLSSDGTERWIYRYNGPGGAGAASSIVYGTDGNIYAAGQSYDSDTSYDFTVINLTTSGVEEWVYRFNNNSGSADEAQSITCGRDGNIYACGEIDTDTTENDFAVISLEGPPGIDEEARTLLSQEKTYLVKVSPFFKKSISLRFTKSSNKSLKITLYNICGVSVFMKTYPDIPFCLTLEDKKIAELSSGVYFLSVFSGKRKLGQVKLIKL